MAYNIDHSEYFERFTNREVWVIKANKKIMTMPNGKKAWDQKRFAKSALSCAFDKDFVDEAISKGILEIVRIYG